MLLYEWYIVENWQVKYMTYLQSMFFDISMLSLYYDLINLNKVYRIFLFFNLVDNFCGRVH